MFVNESKKKWEASAGDGHVPTAASDKFFHGESVFVQTFLNFSPNISNVRLKIKPEIQPSSLGNIRFALKKNLQDYLGIK